MSWVWFDLEIKPHRNHPVEAKIVKGQGSYFFTAGWMVKRKTIGVLNHVEGLVFFFL